jgi:hypothetical protein
MTAGRTLPGEFGQAGLRAHEASTRSSFGVVNPSSHRTGSSLSVLSESRVFQPEHSRAGPDKSANKHYATSEDLSVRTPEPGPGAGTNSEWGTNRQNGVGSEWQAGNIPEFLQQSFATRANASNGAAAARFPSIFAADFCNMRTQMFTGLSAMMQSLPVMRQ